jgi:hypothetical protein
MDMSGDERGAEFTLEARSDRFDTADDRWLRQAGDLYSGLREEGVDVRHEAVAVAGAKGDLSTIILALGSAGAFTTFVQSLKAWLGRDKTRSLSVEWTLNGQTESVTLRGDNSDQEALHRIADAAASRIGSVPWLEPRDAQSSSNAAQTET